MACHPLSLNWELDIGYSSNGFNSQAVVWLNELINGSSGLKNVIETGGGNSTLVFLLNNLKTLTISSDTSLLKDLSYLINQRDKRMNGLWNYSNESTVYEQRLENSEIFDLALIGGHAGFPYPVLDFHTMCR